MTKKYEKPIISKIETRLAGKSARISPEFSQKIRKDIDGISISKLVEDFGSPLFVISEKKIREKYNKANDEFKKRYPNFQFAWSYKTNYLKSVCAVFHDLGSLAEVVSSFEYEKARNLGVPGKNIIFNGPYKSMESLERAAQENAMIHIDNFDEIADLEKVSKKLEKIIPVAIRVNMETGVYPSWSRFGFNFDNGQALDAIKRIRAGGRLVVNGLHTHIGTFILEPKAYSRAVEKLMVLAGHVKTIFGKPIEYIDLGGGFASMSRLKGIYQPPEVTVPSIESYAEAICGALLRNLNEEPYPKLYLESGRHLIDEAGYLITSVLSARNLANGQRGYVMDAGVNLLYTSTWYNYNVESETTGSGNFESSTLLGPLCMNIDVLEEVVMLPRLDKGTRLILSPVGAYNMTQSMQFIHTRPATVLIRESGKVDVIRRKESFSDMEIRENIPQDLQQAVNKKFE